MQRIVQKDTPEGKVLREKARAVKLTEIGTPALNQVISKMKSALKTQADGVAIAAPQIGESLRIFVISKKVFANETSDEEKLVGSPEDRVFINPEIIKHSRRKKPMEEGCLSVRWWYGSVERYTQATVRAFNEDGDEFTLGAGGLLAQIFQHEIDHLDGVLFVDKAFDLEEIPPEESA